MKAIKTFLKLIGFDPRKVAALIRYGPRYIADYMAYKQSHKDMTEPLGLSPRLSDFNSESAKLAKHYFVQDNLVSDYLKSFEPAALIDVGSRVDGFVSQVRHFAEVTTIDVRPPNYSLKNVRSVCCDINALDDGYLQGQWVTCLHTLEHIGLGRYGDPLDAEGDRKAIRALMAMLSPGGNLVCSVPYSTTARTEFNAQRVYSLDSFADLLPSGVVLEKRWILDDNDDECDHKKIVNFGLLICHLRRA